eukprot:8492846-Pyramimonas_sp.AAC.1
MPTLPSTVFDASPRGRTPTPAPRGEWMSNARSSEAYLIVGSWGSVRSLRVRSRRSSSKRIRIDRDPPSTVAGLTSRSDIPPSQR